MGIQTFQVGRAHACSEMQDIFRKENAMKKGSRVLPEKRRKCKVLITEAMRLHDRGRR